jgi:cytochrome c5
VVLTVGDAPDSPVGGEFLHGLGFLDAANLGFDDLTAAGPTGNALTDAIVAASKDYYAHVDPNVDRDTFAKFKAKNAFGATPEIVAQYANSGDLGFGRDMHCLKDAATGNIACYVTNYGNGYLNTPPGGGTPDQDDADAAGQRNTVGNSAEVATVAMEYSPIELDPAGDKVVKFFVYKKALANYGRSISANLDGRGERPVPQLCMICHGGLLPQQSAGVATFGNAADVKLGSRFLPFDHRLFTFPNDPALSQANQEASIKSLNKNIVDLVPAGAPSTDPIREVVKALYDDGTAAGAAAQILNSPVTGWKAGQPAPNNLPGQTNFYNKVVANACRTCHAAQPFPQLQFNTADKFVNLAGVNLPPAGANNKLMLGTAQLRVCGDYVMAHALRTHDIFWGNYTSIDPAIAGISMPLEFQNFGDGVGGSTWKSGLCTSFISSLASTPSNFYEQSIQPIWNGKCVACHVTGGIGPFSLTDGASYPEVVTRVSPPNDDDHAGALLQRITGVGPGSKMPLGCIAPPTPPSPGQLPCLEQSDIDTIKAWIRSGAN